MVRQRSAFVDGTEMNVPNERRGAKNEEPATLLQDAYIDSRGG
jgi:hypothetical protein